MLQRFLDLALDSLIQKLSHTTSTKTRACCTGPAHQNNANPTNTLSHVSLRWGLSWANRNHQCHIYSYLWGQNLSDLDSRSCFNVSAVHWFRVGVIILCPFHNHCEVTTRNLQWIDENNCNLHSFDDVQFWTNSTNNSHYTSLPDQGLL